MQNVPTEFKQLLKWSLQSGHFFLVLLLNGTSIFLRIPQARMWCYLLPTLSVIAVQLRQCRETHVRHTRHKGLLPSTPLQLELSSTPTQETYSAAPQTISGKESTYLTLSTTLKILNQGCFLTLLKKLKEKKTQCFCLLPKTQWQLFQKPQACGIFKHMIFFSNNT